jgi:polar amino acid transport system substrate-binding protein
MPAGGFMRTAMLCFGLLAALSASTHAAEVRLVTLEYPPYTSEQLSNGGSMLALVERAFAATGNSVHIDVLPWARAQLQLSHGKYDGLLPLWPNEVEAANLVSSRALDYSELGFFMRADTPIKFTDLRELSGRRVGAARGYVYPQSIMDSGIVPEDGASDLINLRKLAAKRFDLILLERRVGEHLLSQNPELEKIIVWQGSVLVRIPMSIGFTPAKAGQQQNWPLIFEQGMQQLDAASKPVKRRNEHPDAPSN